jgi:hypothetical protein
MGMRVKLLGEKLRLATLYNSYKYFRGFHDTGIFLRYSRWKLAVHGLFLRVMRSPLIHQRVCTYRCTVLYRAESNRVKDDADRLDL